MSGERRSLAGESAAPECRGFFPFGEVRPCFGVFSSEGSVTHMALNRQRLTQRERGGGSGGRQRAEGDTSQ